MKLWRTVMKTKKLILIVDDNAGNRKVLGSLLMQHNYEVGIAIDGKKALEFINKEQPDLILLDIMMPGLNGFEVCEQLKSKTNTRHIPIIFLTAKTETEDIVRGFKAGGVDYISKPFNSEELLARVRTHIEMKMLRGLLPICASCKSIRDDEGYWHSLEEYLNNSSDILLSHGICQKCLDEKYGEFQWYKNTDEGKE